MANFHLQLCHWNDRSAVESLLVFFSCPSPDVVGSWSCPSVVLGCFHWLHHLLCDPFRRCHREVEIISAIVTSIMGLVV